MNVNWTTRPRLQHGAIRPAMRSLMLAAALSGAAGAAQAASQTVLQAMDWIDVVAPLALAAVLLWGLRAAPWRLLVRATAALMALSGVLSLWQPGPLAGAAGMVAAGMVLAIALLEREAPAVASRQREAEALAQDPTPSDGPRIAPER